MEMQIETMTPEQFASWLESNRAKHRRIVQGWLGSREDAEDVLQDASINALKALGDLGNVAPKKNNNFEGWFYAILHNRCRNFHRDRTRKKRDERGNVRGEFEQLAGTTRGVHLIAEESELHDALLGCISGLDASSQQLVELRFRAGNSLKYVGEKFGVSASAIANRLSRDIYPQLESCLAGKGHHS